MWQRMKILLQQLKDTVLIVTVLLALLLMVVVSIFWPLLFTLLGTNFKMNDDLFGRILLMGIIITLAWFLFSIRSIMRRVYGIGEICVGIAVCWIYLSRATTDDTALTLALVGGTYVIIRGLDNYTQGKQDESKDQKQDK